MFIIDYYSRARLRHQFTLLIQPLRNIIILIFNFGWYLLFLFQSFPFLYLRSILNIIGGTLRFMAIMSLEPATDTKL